MIPDWVFLGVPFVALIVAVLAIRTFTKQTSDAIAKAQKVHDQALTEQVSKLIDSVSTKVILCASQEEVIREATMMVEHARKAYLVHRAGENEQAPVEVEPANEPPLPKLDYTKEDFIAIYGAAALGDHEDQGSKEYKDAIDLAMRNGIRFRRYVRLIKPASKTKGRANASEIKGRSPEVQQSYCKWLCRQYDELLKSPEGFLIDNVRAPQWGSATSTMITNEGILEIKSGGSRALVFYNPSQAASIRRSYREELDSAKPDNRIEYSRSDAQNMKKLREMIIEICKECELSPSAFSDNFAELG